MKGKYNTLGVKIRYHASLETVYLFVILEIRAVVLWWLFWWCCGFLINVICKRLQSITKNAFVRIQQTIIFQIEFSSICKITMIESSEKCFIYLEFSDVYHDFNISICVTYTVCNFVFKSSFYVFIDCFSLQVHTWRDRYQSRIAFSWGYKRHMNNLICQNLWYRGNRHIKFYCPGFISEILTSLLITSKLLIHTFLMYAPDIHTSN